jgi:hypothetical protein
MEHRWGNRISVDQPVRINSAGLSGTGTLRNLSVSGAFIETSLPLSTLAMVRVSIPRSPRARARADARGFVVRRERDGIGIEWFDLAALEPAAVGAAQRQPVAPPRRAAGPDRLTIS